VRLGALVLGVTACTYREPNVPTEIDAPAPPAFVCDPVYTITIAATTSHYSIDATGRSWKDAETSCESTGGHLAAPDLDAEVDALRALVTNHHWVGLVQKPQQPTPSSGWFEITGPPATVQWQLGHPDDSGLPENGEQQAAVLGDQGLDDDPDRNDNPSICECDGIPPDPTVRAYVP
jgi:lectin-like protein